MNTDWISPVESISSLHRWRTDEWVSFGVSTNILADLFVILGLEGQL